MSAPPRLGSSFGRPAAPSMPAARESGIVSMRPPVPSAPPGRDEHIATLRLAAKLAYVTLVNADATADDRVRAAATLELAFGLFADEPVDPTRTTGSWLDLGWG